jgi:hypothetical protein
MTDRIMTSAQQDALEALVDSCGLDLVLSGLGNICASKSDHVLTNWQDRRLADCWMKAMTVCDRAADNSAIGAVS